MILPVDFLATLHSLIRVPSVVGAERAFFHEIRREMEELSLKVTLYEGVMEVIGSDPGAGTVCAHVDRHGLVATGPNELQYAAFVAQHRGDLRGDSVSEQMLDTISSRFKGQRVYAYHPWSGIYRERGEITESHFCESRGNLVFRVDGLKGIHAGYPVAYEDRLAIEDDRLSAQLDNVISVAVIIELFRRGFQGRALFTAQEEAGRSWRYLLAYFRRLGITDRQLLVLDTSPFPDAESVARQDLVLRNRDAGGIFEPAVVEALRERCDILGVTHTMKDEFVTARNLERLEAGLPMLSLGRTELGRLVEATNGEINGATLQIPTYGYHTARETATFTSVAAMLALLENLFVHQPLHRERAQPVNA